MPEPDHSYATPERGYALLDAGGGRVLERLGAWVVARPHPAATGTPSQARWSADWSFEADAWRARAPDQPRAWEVAIGTHRHRCHLESDGGIALRPDQAPCWDWLQGRLQAASRPARVLNLFAGPGAATATALALGARVVHVTPDAAALAAARRRLGDARPGLRWVLDDVAGFVHRARHRPERFDIVLLDAPRFLRGAGDRTWDLQRDLPRLLNALARLFGPRPLGLWVSLRSRDWSPASLEQLLRQYFPGRRIEGHRLALAGGGGRALATGVAASWAAEASAGRRRALDAAALEDRLEAHLDAALSSRRTAAEPARRLAALGRTRQDAVLSLTVRAARTSAELAFQFACRAPAMLERVDEAALEAWLMQAIDAYDSAGLHAAIASLDTPPAPAARAAGPVQAVGFEEVSGMLEAFVRGLSGRALRLATAARAFTDTETLFLPPFAGRFAARADNFRLYKAMAAHQWAQIRFGTWRADLAAAVAPFPDRHRALAALHALETCRLDAAIGRTLQGLHREMQALRAAQMSPNTATPAWEGFAQRLRRPEASVEDSLALLGEAMRAALPEAACYQGELDPAAAAAVREARLERERTALRLGLAKVAEAHGHTRTLAGEADRAPPRLRAVRARDPRAPGGLTLRLELDGRPLAAPPDLRRTAASIVQDLGDLPEDCLVPAGAGDYARAPAARDPADVWKGTYHEEGALRYREWDYERRHYRKNWAVLRELDADPGDPGFAARTLERHRGLVKQLRRGFEALRGEDRVLGRQPQGDDLDLDALVAATVEARAGREMSARVFTERRKRERDVAVMFLVDMSGSTRGWVNDAERTALLLLCESLEALGDRYAIYGFSGTTRKRCELYRIKRLEERYDATVRRRIAGIRPRDYTRMGVVLRHLAELLAAVEARTRLLVTLSDGKPDDLDGYRGEYGIEDTRMALIEARRLGIHPYCVTIDTEARDYLAHMYGAVNYTVIDEARKLPLKLAEVYRRISS